MRVAGLYAIVDLPHPRGLTALELTRAFVEGGAGVLQLRAKRASATELRAILRTIAPICHAAAVPLLVNDDLDAAQAGIPGVVGVHLGQTDLASLGQDPVARIQQLHDAGLRVGISTHTLEQVQAALALGPDYLGFGPVFSTTTKLDADPVVGIEGLGQACARAEIPVVAIGGIGPERFDSVLKAGAAAIAVIGALIADSGQQTRERCHALATRLAMIAAS